MTTLRLSLGARTVQDCIEHRESLANEILEIIGPAAISWGVKVESILLKDLRFSEELQESLSSAAKQKRIGEARIIAARAEGMRFFEFI
jgi:regulator of protease activity HflC (stomatin/prohibitin superfamily)